MAPTLRCASIPAQELTLLVEERLEATEQLRFVLGHNSLLHESLAAFRKSFSCTLLFPIVASKETFKGVDLGKVLELAEELLDVGDVDTLIWIFGNKKLLENVIAPKADV